jgi:Glycosyl hydrolases family 16
MAAVVTTALLVGFGGQHSGAPDGQTLDPTAKLGPLSAPATLNTDAGAADPVTSSSKAAGHSRAGGVQRLQVTAPSKTVVTHPTPTTTVTTVTRTSVKPTVTTVTTTVTTVTVHPATPVNAITHPTVPAPPTTTTTVTTTTATTPTPVASSNGALPTAPASAGAPATMVLDDEFSTGALNTSLWAPDWFGSGNSSNATTMLSSNVSVGANGLALQLNGPQSGGLVSSDPEDGQPGHTGFQIAPTPTKPVFVEFRATVPGSANGMVANWPALWLVGQTWPEDGEIDVMEGLGGTAAYHIHYGSGAGTAQGGSANHSAGTHTYGVLWTTTGVTFFYDGVAVGTATEALTNPMFLVMENSYDSGDPTLVPATLDVRYVRVWN